MSDTAIISTTTTDYGVRLRVRLEYDPDAGNPREDHDQAGTLVLRMHRHNLPCEGDLIRQIDEAMERGGFRLAERYLRTVHGAPVVLPVWAYDHGDLALCAGDRVGQYADKWDSGLAGLAYVSAETVRTGWTEHGVDVTDDELAALLRAELDEYNAWATGEVFGCIVERAPADDPENWQEVEACWGHIGHSWATQAALEALAEAVGQGAAEHAQQQAAEAEDHAEIESLRLIEGGG